MTAQAPCYNSAGGLAVNRILSLLALCTLLVLSCAPPQPESPWRGGLVAQLEPAGAEVGLVILHQGHSSFDAFDYPPADLWPAARAFAEAGYKVACFEMPPFPHVAPVERFYTPVLRYIDAVPLEVPIFMVGLSGGGWMTTVVSALSQRIRRGYSVAGDLPLDLRTTMPADPGDWEQQHPPLPYRTLYAMAAGRLLHIFNAQDPVCFRYSGTADELGGPFLVDRENTTHSISGWALNVILADMRNVLLRRCVDRARVAGIDLSLLLRKRR